ncbi:MAG: hypothetical protein O7G88_06405 [bacterium]|nr:hypothetical protein [bacterium]
MDYKENNTRWTKKGATLSDKTAQKEYSLTQQEIFEAIKAGKLDYRHNTLYGNPSLKLLRDQVEANTVRHSNCRGPLSRSSQVYPYKMRGQGRQFGLSRLT